MKNLILFCIITGMMSGCQVPSSHETSLSHKTIKDTSVETAGTSVEQSVQPHTTELQKSIKAEDKDNLIKYNSIYDNYEGVIEKGKEYLYDPTGYDRDLQYKVLQVLNDEEVLVMRYGSKCEMTIFLIVSDTAYADGVSLRKGCYICDGTYTYETNDRSTKTVYVLIEKGFAQKIN